MNYKTDLIESLSALGEDVDTTHDRRAINRAAANWFTESAGQHSQRSIVDMLTGFGAFILNCEREAHIRRERERSTLSNPIGTLYITTRPDGSVNVANNSLERGRELEPGEKASIAIPNPFGPGFANLAVEVSDFVPKETRDAERSMPILTRYLTARPDGTLEISERPFGPGFDVEPGRKTVLNAADVGAVYLINANITKVNNPKPVSEPAGLFGTFAADAENAARRIVDAWEIPGRVASYHRAQRHKLQREWRMLYNAICNLSELAHSNGYRPGSTPPPETFNERCTIPEPGQWIDGEPVGPDSFGGTDFPHIDGPAAGLAFAAAADRENSPFPKYVLEVGKPDDARRCDKCERWFVGGATIDAKFVFCSPFCQTSFHYGVGSPLTPAAALSPAGTPETAISDRQHETDGAECPNGRDCPICGPRKQPPGTPTIDPLTGMPPDGPKCDQCGQYFDAANALYFRPAGSEPTADNRVICSVHCLEKELGIA